MQLAAWDPENEKQWEATGRFIARRNLLASIPNLLCGFGVWLVWSVISTKIQKMHDADPNVYPFADWGSPQGSDVSLVAPVIITRFVHPLLISAPCQIPYSTAPPYSFCRASPDFLVVPSASPILSSLK